MSLLEMLNRREQEEVFDFVDWQLLNCDGYIISEEKRDVCFSALLKLEDYFGWEEATANDVAFVRYTPVGGQPWDRERTNWANFILSYPAWQGMVELESGENMGGSVWTIDVRNRAANQVMSCLTAIRAACIFYETPYIFSYFLQEFPWVPTRLAFILSNQYVVSRGGMWWLREVHPHALTLNRIGQDIHNWLDGRGNPDHPFLPYGYTKVLTFITDERDGYKVGSGLSSIENELSEIVSYLYGVWHVTNRN